MAVPPRDLSPFMRWFRNFLLGRPYKNSLRFQDLVATRSPPPPALPDGPCHKLSENYYFTRDGRRAVRPPVVLIEDSKKLALPTGDKKDSPSKGIETKKGQITPGNPFVWHKSVEQQSKQM